MNAITEPCKDWIRVRQPKNMVKNKLKFGDEAMIFHLHH